MSSAHVRTTRSVFLFSPTARHMHAFASFHAFLYKERLGTPSCHHWLPGACQCTANDLVMTTDDMSR